VGGVVCGSCGRGGGDTLLEIQGGVEFGLGVVSGCFGALARWWVKGNEDDDGMADGMGIQWLVLLNALALEGLWGI
jgi:hypothetical protein